MSFTAQSAILLPDVLAYLEKQLLWLCGAPGGIRVHKPLLGKADASYLWGSIITFRES
jgi:hypothetical protein